MKTVVHLTSTHFPFDARVFHKECRTLAEAGYDTHLVVPHDANETVEKVRVHGVASPDTRLERLVKTTTHVVRTGWALDADLYHVHDPELLPLAVLLAESGRTVVYDAHEDFPASLRARSWVPENLRTSVSWMAGHLESLLSNRLDGIIAATPAIKDRFSTANPPVVPVQNFPILDDIDRVASTIPYLERPPRMAYVGGLTNARGADQMIEALGQVDSSLDPSMTIAGSFEPDVLRERVTKKEGWNRVDFRGRVSQQEVFRILKRARLGLVVMQPVPNYVEAQPLKLFEYMAAGIPIVASDFPLWREIIGEANCGMLVDPQQPREIAEAIEWLLRHPEEAEEMGRRGRAAVEHTYNWEEESHRLLSLYRLLLE